MIRKKIKRKKTKKKKTKKKIKNVEKDEEDKKNENNKKEEDSYGIDYNKYDYYKGEDPKEEVMDKFSDCSCPKKCCVHCESGTGCCLCLKKPTKCTKCKKEAKEESIRRGREWFSKQPRRELTETHEVELIDIRNSRKIPLLPSNSINLTNFHTNSTNMGINSTNRTSMGISSANIEIVNHRSPRERFINLFLHLIYLLIMIYMTIVLRNSDGFDFQSITSLYVMIVGLFILVFMTNIRKTFK